ncbi:hypothetical protein ACPPVS_12745 [Cellulomonas sp. McL0617]|uniref:hypothetical protein n=1 Tax=Cellulomonas sp. McL0617 TaxID=3415675 RepID=UPI003CED91AD
MGAAWNEPASALLERGAPGWAGLCALLDAASHGALTLSLAVPLGAGVDLTFAAIELGEAREELTWSRRRPSSDATSRLGPLHVRDDLGEALQIIEHLVDVAIDRTLTLDDDEATPDDLDCLGKVLRKLHNARQELASAVA